MARTVNTDLRVQTLGLGAVVLSSLTAGCVTVGAYGGVGLVIDQERRVGLRIGGGAEPGFTSDRPDRDRAFTLLMLDLGAGIDLTAGAPFADLRLGALGLAYHSSGSGHRASVGIQVRFSGRGHTAGPSIAYAFERVLSSSRDPGLCPDESTNTFTSAGGAGYAHVHPLTECGP